LPHGLAEQRISGGLYACTEHRGPYQGLGDIWARFLGEWLPSSEHCVADGRGFEIYRTTPEQVAPDELITELYAPLEG
jgi:AraC family transcriptional regulator